MAPHRSLRDGADLQPNAEAGIKVEEQHSAPMQLSCFLHEIEAKAGTGGAGVDAMERFEHLLAFVNGYARTFITDIYGSCCTHPDDNGAPAAAVIDGIADEVDDGHLNDRRLDRQ